MTQIQIPPGPRDSAGLLGWSPQLGQSLVLLGMSNYEDGSAQGGGVMRINLLQKQVGELIQGARQSVGPLTMGDPDGDGDGVVPLALDLLCTCIALACRTASMPLIDSLAFHLSWAAPDRLSLRTLDRSISTCMRLL